MPVECLDHEDWGQFASVASASLSEEKNSNLTNGFHAGFRRIVAALNIALKANSRAANQ